MTSSDKVSKKLFEDMQVLLVTLLKVDKVAIFGDVNTCVKKHAAWEEMLGRHDFGHLRLPEPFLHIPSRIYFRSRHWQLLD
ncbi:unnamed protein product [Schistocephalus solidus]|uniref:Endo/exonuclease/phosphatase domain-containing protein n=1 Tax=Schistocephalus solidus TaxID=70667 RepID=A0A183S776_SCHSO|nr:unnamed protein product [Schistocephalus solidus]